VPPGTFLRTRCATEYLRPPFPWRSLLRVPRDRAQPRSRGALPAPFVNKI